MKKPDSVVVIPCTRDDFFRQWFEFLEPFHKLTPREMDVAAAYVKLRFELKKSITDTDLLDSVLMSEESKVKIREMCGGITSSHFQVILGKLRRSGIIVNDKLNARYVPDRDNLEQPFTMMFYFKFDDDKSK